MEFDGAFFSHVVLWAILALTGVTGVAIVGACVAMGRSNQYGDK